MPLTMLRADDPRQVGPFQLQGRLGSGGMGVVYLAFGADGGAVALKTLPPGAGDDARTRLRREADLLVGVRSPFVARCVGVDTASAVPWIAMDYVPGPTLHEAPTPLPDPVLRLLATGLARALTTLHEQGIVHRDVKPANVILTHQGPVLVDLGIARTPDLAALTQVGLVVGSPGWMAPEQMDGRQLTTAVDVWGWGCAVLYAATGRAPFGDAPIEVLLHRVRSDEADLTGVPPWLLQPLGRALVKDPVARATAAELSALLDGGPVTAVLAPTPTLGAPVPGAVAPAPKQRGLALALSAALAAVVIGAVAWLVVPRGGDDRQTGAATGTPTGALPSSPAGQPSPSSSPSATFSSPTAPAEPTPTSTPDPTTGIDQGEAWGDGDIVLRAVRSQDEPVADFLTEVDGYRLADEESRTVPLVQGGGWRAPSGLLVTDDDCDQQRFYVRWRSLDPDADIEATWLDADATAVLTTSVRGRAGWQSADGCSLPGFQVRSVRGRSRATLVLLDIQRWEASR